MYNTLVYWSECKLTIHWWFLDDGGDPSLDIDKWDVGLHQFGHFSYLWSQHESVNLTDHILPLPKVPGLASENILIYV